MILKDCLKFGFASIMSLLTLFYAASPPSQSGVSMEPVPFGWILFETTASFLFFNLFS